MQISIILILLQAALSLSNKHRIKSKSSLKKDDEPAVAVQSSDHTPPVVISEGWFSLASEHMTNDNTFPDIPDHAGPNMKYFTDEDQKKYTAEGVVLRENSLQNTNFGKIESIPSCDSFYIRIFDDKLTISETDTDMIIIATFKPKKITEFTDDCLEVADIDQTFLMCSKDRDILEKLECDIKTILGQPCEEKDAVASIPKKKMLQPLMIIPLPSPDCETDWNYNFHGDDWVCKCNEGHEQSPIDLPHGSSCEQITTNADFQYNNIPKLSLKVVYENNMVRIKPAKAKGGASFGQITDTDGSVYNGVEIQIHTPAEHTIQGKIYDMEIQVIHEATDSANMKMMAILSFIYEDTPGSINTELANWDLLNLPNPGIPRVNDFFEKDLNVLNLMMTHNTKDEINQPFSYYKYMGSITSPPCAENVIWFVHETPIPQGSTGINMIRDALNPPGKTPHDKQPNYDGSNRNVQPIRRRKVMFYDKLNGCSSDIRSGDQFQSHYEKLIEPQESYIYVQGQKPSGVPNAQVVSESEANGPTRDKTRTSDRYEVNQLK